MKRLEETKMLVEQMMREVKCKLTGTNEEMVTFQLGMIATVLLDISRSLAVIADKTESEEK